MKSFELSNNFVIKAYTGSIFDSKLDCEAIVISTFKKVLFKRNFSFRLNLKKKKPFLLRKCRIGQISFGNIWFKSKERL